MGLIFVFVVKCATFKICLFLDHLLTYISILKNKQAHAMQCMSYDYQILFYFSVLPLEPHAHGIEWPKNHPIIFYLDFKIIYFKVS